MGALAVAAIVAAAPAMAATHADLVRLYDGFRTAVEMPVKNGVPDHGNAVMAARAATADKMVADLLAIDSNAWPVAQRADHLLVLSEARSVQFQHKVLRQWQRDPSWWATLDIGWGPKINTAF
jgi:3-methyladenine DNA glycosylase AlkD